MRVGILGGGQLGRMLALAGYPLGLRFRFLDRPGSPAGDVGELVEGDLSDEAALARFAEGLDAATYEFENVPVKSVRILEARLPTFPPSAALAAAQDRLNEKSLFTRLGIPTPGYFNVLSRADLSMAAAALGLPAILKTRRGGYDGKGQFLIRVPEDAEAAWAALGTGAAGGAGGSDGTDEGRTLILEQFIHFARELSVLAVRSRRGEVAFYPLVQNLHAGGILRRSTAPAPGLSDDLQAQAERHAAAVMEELGYIGVLAIEFFEVADPGGSPVLLANEMAPRVHNSGHWTIEGAATSQFENHLRAILGLPLGATTPLGASAMLNLIGSAPPLSAMLAVPGAHVHLYGKTPRPGRKIGHITLCAADHERLMQRVAELRPMVDES
jgi:5-(carboxyamino)imidazole ribonucleotide synthase